MYPLPVDIKKCTPQWPPTNITCVAPGLKTIDRCSYPEHYKFIDDSYSNTGEEHVFFHVRKKITFNEQIGVRSLLKFPSHKTANRLYMSWSVGIPGVFTDNTAMQHIRHSVYDYLTVDSKHTLEEQIQSLVDNEQLYWKMVDVCNKRSTENIHDVIARQWTGVFDCL